MDTAVVKSLSKLRWGKFSPAYRGRLLEAGRELERFLKQENLQWQELLKCSTARVDEVMSWFVHRMHQLNDARAFRVAKHSILFMQIWQPRLRRHLPATWNFMIAWEEMRPASFRPPLPIVLLIAMVCDSRSRSWQSKDLQTQEMWLLFSVMICVGFLAMMRPGELFKLRLSDINLPNDLSLGSESAVIRIQEPKNSRQMGRQQYATIRHPDVINWLVWVVKRKDNPSTFLWPSSQQKFRALFQESCSRLKLKHCRFSPASLRAGGATFYVDSHRVDIGRLRFEGRWTNLRSVEHYVQTAKSQQLLLQMPDSTSHEIRLVVLRFSFVMSLPQYLALKLPSQYLVPSSPLLIRRLEDVPRACRDWGKRDGAEETI